MFDNGTAPVGVQNISPPTNILSGDLLAGDGIFTRKVYFGTTTSSGSGFCLQENDRDTIGHTYSVFDASIDLAPTASLGFEFTVQAIDRAGNIATSTNFPLSLQGTFRETIQGQQRPCHFPPLPSGGCSPGP
jgi:hypothetical protein